jgi:long-chain acyl-CoA synthetase
MRLPTLAFCLSLVLTAPAGATSPAQELAGVRVPAHVQVAGRDLVLNGAGLRRFLALNLYVAALYLPERSQRSGEILDRDMPRSLQVTLLRQLSTQKNLDVLKEGLYANNSPDDIEAINQEVERFLGLLRGLGEVPAGTTLQLNYLPGTGTHVSVNQRHLGTIPGEAFNRAVLRIWLGEDPAQAALKKALLGAT